MSKGRTFVQAFFFSMEEFIKFVRYGWTFRKLNFRANSTHLSYNQKGRYFQKYFDKNESIQGKEGMNWKK